MEIHRTLVAPDGVTLGYRVIRGETPRRLIVLLHGMASNMTRWSEFVERTTLKQSWDIMRLDLRGHGESFWRGALGIDRWCEDLENILDTEGYAQALFIGHSLGAQVAVRFAARRPARVRGLVLIDPVFHQALRGGMLTASRMKPAIRLLIGWIRLLNGFGLRRRHIPNRDLRELDEATRSRFLNLGKQQEMIALYSSPWEDLKFFPTASFMQELLEMIRPLPPLSSLPMPILALLSTGITYTDPVLTRQMLADHPQTEIVTIDAYHWPLTEKPEQVREAIERWCEQLPP
ncbi:MAG TPA: alpha/beta hydrolase [Candidatus Methylomirabilis sp.]|nr:alpha/beta hydrolase [Candidatus Methylomirabilis sp.]